jgi:hypothetical protein
MSMPSLAKRNCKDHSDLSLHCSSGDPAIFAGTEHVNHNFYRTGVTAVTAPWH